MSRRRGILMVAFHYPPIQGSSGIHRTLSFSAELASAGWDTTVLTVTRNALPSARRENEALIHEGVRVLRAPALDTTRHLALGGKYVGALAVPDRWISWVAGGIVCGLWHVLRHRPAVLYSTYPIATAHVIGHALHRLTGTPWIADFRDPMAQDDYPTDPRQWRAFRRIEARAMQHAARVLFTAPGAAAYYEARYPGTVDTRGEVIENGYDEVLFERAEQAASANARDTGPLRLVHAGLLYPSERDPRAFFAAVAALKARGAIRPGDVEIVLRGSGHDELYAPMLRQHGIDDVVALEAPVGYEAALREMLEADGLLLFQSAGCNFQIPAKTYEYFRARRPIIAFTDPEGDTAGVLRAGGYEAIAPLDSAERIEAVLASFLEELAANRDRSAGSDAHVASCARSARGREFLDIVEAVASGA